jgi:glycosyltransferase involved in cell wall biosynthesis
MLTPLSRTYEVLGLTRIARRFLPRSPLRYAGSVWLRRVVLPEEQSREDDVTVLIGVRNRAGYRLANALRSLREQTYPADGIRVVVIDYGSEPETAEEVERLCGEGSVEYVHVGGVSAWSRSRCLNVGLRRAATKFLLSSDVDILFSPHYVADAVDTLRLSPLSYVCSAMLDLPEESAEMLERAACVEEALELDTWRRLSRPRHGWEHHPTICMTYTAVLQAMRGYDEYYEGWGWEDDDLARRLAYLGLSRRILDPSSYYLHQWHPEAERPSRLEQYKAHFDGTHSILRNDSNWGVAPASTDPSP